MLLLDLPSNCNAGEGKEYAFVRNDDPAFNGRLSVLLSAKSNDRSVRIFIDDTDTTNNAVRIQIVHL